MADPGNSVYFSAISIWEVAIKHAKGLLALGPDRLRESSMLAGIRELPGQPVAATPRAIWQNDPLKRNST